jgi:outer membrane receptor protein involved in Fe transport
MQNNKNLQAIKIIIYCFIYFLSLPIFSQETGNIKLLIGRFTGYSGTADKDIEQKILDSLKSNFNSKSFESNFSKGTRNLNLKFAKENDLDFYLEGYYRLDKDKKFLTLYAQIYNTNTGLIIDAIFETNNINEKLNLNAEEIQDKKPDSIEKTIQKFTNNIILSLQSNPNKIEITENINERLLTKSLGKEFNFPISKTGSSSEANRVLKELSEVEVVTASRKSQKISDAPSKVIVFSKDTIYERGYRTLTELLQDVPGFDFNSFNDSGEYPTDLILRGISDVGQTQILLMENGIIQNDIGNGWLRHVQFDTLLVDIDRIEIILGPGSSLYGANAYAGLINIITKKGKSIFKNSAENFRSETRLQVGKNNTYMPEGFFAYKLPNDMIFQLGGRYYNTEGDRGSGRMDPGNYFKNNYEPEKVQTSEYGLVGNDRFLGTNKRLKDGFNNSAKDFFVRGSLTKDGFSLGFNLWDLKEGLGSYVPSYEYFTNTKGIDYQKHHRGYYLNANYETNITSNLSSISKLYYRNTTIMPDTGFAYTYRFQSIDFPTTDTGRILPPVADKLKQYYGPSYLTGFQQQFQYKLNSTNDLIFGIQIDRFVRQSISDGVGGVSLGQRQDRSTNRVNSAWQSQKPNVATIFYSTTYSAFIQDEQKFFREKLNLTLGLRYDEDSDYKKIFTRRGALIFKPINLYNLKLLYGEAFKAPTVFQLYDEFRGNRNLEPQKIKTYEIENSFFNHSKGNLKLGYFISQLRGLIAEGRNPDQFASTGKEEIFLNFKPNHIYGYSLEGEWNIIPEVKLFANYTITRDRDPKTRFQIQTNQFGSIKSIEELRDGSEIDNIAERKANLGGNFIFFKNWNLNLRMNWVGRRKAPITNRYFQPWDASFIQSNYTYQTEGKPDGYLSPYTLVNSTLTYKDMFGWEGLDFQIIVRNLLNKSFLGMGRQSGNATRPIDEIQPRISNPAGFVSPYHPQAGREIFIQIVYSF